MTQPTSSYARYLPVEPEAEAWGLHVLDCGYATIAAGAPYPEAGHPAEYHFAWEQGRRLSEFQLLYVAEGSGEFESASGGRHRIQPGCAFLLFPGEWHRYRPDPRVGWMEYWVGFDGRYARDLMQHSFRVDAPVFQVAQPDVVRELIRSVTELMEAGHPGYPQIMAARTLEVLARIRIPPPANDEAATIARKMRLGRMALLAHATGEIDLEALAHRLSMSYSGFRSHFREQTGSSPRQFQLQIRINRAKALLTQTNLPVAEIAEQTGFTSVYYFSRFFKQKTGSSPSAYRIRAGTSAS